MKSYNAIIDEQLESGIVEPVMNDDENTTKEKRIHFMPHHA
jgi:hypothetical protein